MTKTWIATLAIIASLANGSLLPANAANVREAALNAVKDATYKQSGLEANVRQLETYAKSQRYSKVVVSTFAIYRAVQERKVVLNIDYSKVLTLTPGFGSISLRF